MIGGMAMSQFRREVRVWVIAFAVMVLIALALSGLVAIQRNTEVIAATARQRIEFDQATHRVEFFHTRTAERP